MSGAARFPPVGWVQDSHSDLASAQSTLTTGNGDCVGLRASSHASLPFDSYGRRGRKVFPRAGRLQSPLIIPGTRTPIHTSTPVLGDPLGD